jgi:hypothetical protein
MLGTETLTMSAPGCFQRVDLRNRCRYVAGFCVGHALHADRRIAADCHAADVNLATLAPLYR